MFDQAPQTPDPAISHVIGASEPPLLDETVGQMLARIAASWPQRPALVVPPQNVRMSWQEFDQAVSNLAAGLLQTGLRPGDRIGIWSLNRYEWVLMQFATARAGLVLVNINPAYRTHELEYALNKVGCRALVIVPTFKTSNYLGMLRELAPELERQPAGMLRLARLPDLRHVLVMGDAPAPNGTTAFNTVADCTAQGAHSLLAAIQPLLDPTDAVNIQFTSGTTGSPKGATLTHRNIVNNGFFIGEAMRLTEQDALCIPVPFYHCFGMVLGNLACVTHGSCMVIPGEGFDPLVTLQTVADEKCTGLHGVPTMFIAELQDPKFPSFNLSSLRTGIMAGSNCPIEVMKQVVDRMNMKQVTIAYGMTETSPVSFQTTPDDPLDRRVDSVGRIQPHLQARVVDEQGNTVPRGEIGELLTRGYSVMQGYWGDPKLTAEAVDADGWMHTGDQAMIDADGYCRIVGRLKDMLIRGGENIYPREIEEFLYTHPDIADVQIFGVPDPKFGEEACAWIRLTDGASLDEAQVRAFCTGKIAQYKIPRYVEFVDEMPMTVTGKIQKYVMRADMTRRLRERGLLPPE